MNRSPTDRRQFLIASLQALAVGAVRTGAMGAGAAFGLGASLPVTAEPADATATHSVEKSDESFARVYESERKFAQIRAGRIAYIDRGSGPSALFLHGFPLSSFQWRGAIDRLAAGRRCLAPDFLGLGRTEVAPGQSVAPGAQADMLAALLDRLGVNDVDLIANDTGGAVAQLFMTRYPDRVRTVLLTNCDSETGGLPAAIRPMIEAGRSGLLTDLWLLPWLQHKEVARSPAGLGGLCYTHPERPTDAALEEYLRPLVSSEERKECVNRYAAALASNPLSGIEARLRDCKVPTRIVWGMSDAIFSSRTPDYFANVLPVLRGVRRISDAKLFFPEEYPHVIAEEARLLWSLA